MGKPNSAGQKKRQKYHDKDKYYKLAREQGYRSRAAYKLLQIDRKYRFLSHARSVLDLCAAPGGWSQVAARADKVKTVVAVDLLPIRAIRGVDTLVGDITTEKCRADIRRAFRPTATEGAEGSTEVDVVLCDGAPDVGADYARDAFVQNEIVLLALRCAGEHLRRGGSFVTKVYRSKDYNALLYVMQKFFGKVSAVKPAASRQASAEIFWMCENYKKPDKIDPRLLDPKSVFDAVEDEKDTSSATVNVFHKNYGQQKRPSRHGYDLEKSGLDFSMRNRKTVGDFVASNDPVTMLTQCTEFEFDPDADERYKTHRLTTQEILTCVQDLRVLNRGDFRTLMQWRDSMVLFDKKRAAKAQSDIKGDTDGDGDSDEDDAKMKDDSEMKDDDDDDSVSSDEEAIQGEIEAARAKKLREKKRKLKKERALAAKLRQRRAYGMDLNAIDVPVNDGELDGRIFSLAAIQSKKVLNKFLSKKDADTMDTDEESGSEDESVDEAAAKKEGADDDLEDLKRLSSENQHYLLEQDLDQDYNRYLKGTKNAAHKVGTKASKRAKSAKDAILRNNAAEDEDILKMVDGTDSNLGAVSTDALNYAKMLNAGTLGASKNNEDEDSDSTDAEEFDDVDEDGDVIEQGPKSANAAPKNNITDGTGDDDANPLIYKLTEPSSAKAERWFSNPLFDSMNDNKARKVNNDTQQAAMDIDSSDEDEDDESSKSGKRQKVNKDVDVNDMIANMPKTDKQKRHEKRLKGIERNERRKTKKEAKTNEDFEIIAGNAAKDPKAKEAEDEKLKFDQMDPEKKKKIMAARDLIRAGLGSAPSAPDAAGFEVAPAPTPLLPRHDSRAYASDEEHYDSDDHARNLAIGTMMLRKSRAQALVDASYNRYAWNDPVDLPDWFADDEKRNYRPQLPLPPALVAKMKERFDTLATKPIAKVAEARARKRKRANVALVAAKKKAEAVAGSSDMTEAQKLKTISRAMRGSDSKRPEKKYVRSKKNGSIRGSKGVKLVDKRERSDKRGMDRAKAGKKKKKGKRR